MKVELQKFLKKTDELEALLDFFHQEKHTVSSLEASYHDFYLKNIISNNYTNFETYLRNCLLEIVEELSTLMECREELISKDLQLDIIQKTINKLPVKTVTEKNHRKKDRIFQKKEEIQRLYNMIIKGIYVVDSTEHSFRQLPHSLPELEALLCMYFHQEKILHNILIKQKKNDISGLELEEEESAFAYLNRNAEKLRHPIVHEGLIVYQSTDLDLSIDYVYLKTMLDEFRFIATELNVIFVQYSEVIMEASSKKNWKEKEISLEEIQKEEIEV